MQKFPGFDIRQALIDSAQSYFDLLNCDVVLRSPNFIERDGYLLRFFETNFLHLTGVRTRLSKEDFYHKCYDGTIQRSDYSLGPGHEKRTIKRKLKKLINIGSYFKSELMVQESFVKNHVVCRVATSDGECTIGFADAKYYLRPQSLLANNHLDQNKPIIRLIPIIKSKSR